MLTQAQNQIVTLMFLNGLLFLSLNFIARSLVFPPQKKSKRIGYMLILIAALSMVVTQQYRLMQGLEFSSAWSRNILLGGFTIPVFFFSLVYYRIRKGKSEPEIRRKQNDVDRS